MSSAISLNNKRTNEIWSLCLAFRALAAADSLFSSIGSISFMCCMNESDASRLKRKEEIHPYWLVMVGYKLNHLIDHEDNKDYSPLITQERGMKDLIGSIC